MPGGYRERESERVMAQILDLKNPTPPGAAKAKKATSLGSVGMGQHRNPHPQHMVLTCQITGRRPGAASGSSYTVWIIVYWMPQGTGRRAQRARVGDTRPDGPMQATSITTSRLGAASGGMPPIPVGQTSRRCHYQLPSLMSLMNLCHLGLTIGSNAANTGRGNSRNAACSVSLRAAIAASPITTGQWWIG